MGDPPIPEGYSKQGIGPRSDEVVVSKNELSSNHSTLKKQRAEAEFRETP